MKRDDKIDIPVNGTTHAQVVKIVFADGTVGTFVGPAVVEPEQVRDGLKLTQVAFGVPYKLPPGLVFLRDEEGRMAIAEEKQDTEPLKS